MENQDTHAYLKASAWYGREEWVINHSFQPCVSPFEEIKKLPQGFERGVHFDQKGMATILIKQKYDQLFYQPDKPLSVPIKAIYLNFYDESFDDVISISITQIINKFETPQEKKVEYKIKITLTRTYNYLNNTLNELRPIEETIDKTLLFPPAEEAPKMLRKKIWVQINKLNHTLRIATGDIANFQTDELFFYDFTLDLAHKKRDTWNDQQDNYPLPKYSGGNAKQPSLEENKPKRYNPRVKNILGTISLLNVVVQVNKKENILGFSSDDLINFLQFKFMNVVRNLESAVSLEPTILNPRAATLQLLPKTISILYGYLKNLQVVKLPDYKAKPNELAERQIYLGWKDMQSAIHYSLTTPYGYRTGIENIKDKQSRKRPVGILNHLFKLKYGQDYKHFIFNRSQDENEQKRSLDQSQENKCFFPTDRQTFQTKEQMMKYIYDNRVGYVRLELLDHEGLAPGSMAVLQVWPPYYCSPIHNHGEGYGLIKVLAGKIRVQNYSDLTFYDYTNPKPFQVMDYTQNQYTWLSEESFGIHRLVNMNDQTCLNLQSYYYENESNEYFTVIERSQQNLKQKKGKKHRKLSNAEIKADYVQFYPQNDWKDYLNLPKIQESLPKEKQISPDDLDFINSVIKTYKLDEDGPEVNYQFYKLALIMRDQYQYARNFENTQPNYDYLPQKEDKNVIYQIGGSSIIEVTGAKVIPLPSQKHLELLLSNQSNWRFFSKRTFVFLYTYESYNSVELNMSNGINFMIRTGNTIGFPESLQIVYFQKQLEGNQTECTTISTDLLYVYKKQRCLDQIKKYFEKNKKNI